jgi:hypothetical protein
VKIPDPCFGGAFGRRLHFCGLAADDGVTTAAAVDVFDEGQE